MTTDGWRWAAATDASQRMMDMTMGYQVSQIIRAVAEFNLADHLAGSAHTASELADKCGVSPESMFRLLRVGVPLGLFTPDDEGCFRGTALLGTLQSGTPDTMRGIALALTSPAHWRPWGEFVTSVQTGISQAEQALGMHFFEYLQSNTALAEEFSAGMDGATAMWGLDAAAALDTGDADVAVDVGGANGAFLELLQERNPSLRGIVFDRPNVVSSIAPVIAAGRFADRTDVVGGDFFSAVPSGDLYLLKFILHDWDDENCIAILRSCREAMNPGGRLAIVELRLGPTDDPGLAALMDLNMLACLGGRERTVDDYDLLLQKAGLRRSSNGRFDSHVLIEAVVA